MAEGGGGSAVPPCSVGPPGPGPPGPSPVSQPVAACRGAAAGQRCGCTGELRVEPGRLLRSRLAPPVTPPVIQM